MTAKHDFEIKSFTSSGLMLLHTWHDAPGSLLMEIGAYEQRHEVAWIEVTNNMGILEARSAGYPEPYREIARTSKFTWQKHRQQWVQF